LIEGSSVPLLLGIPPGGYQRARSSSNEIIEYLPRIVDMFHREIDTEAVLGHLVLIGLFLKSAKFTGQKGPSPTANPNSWNRVYSRSHVFILGDNSPRIPGSQQSE